MKLPSELQNDNRSYIMLQIKELTEFLHTMDNWAAQFGIEINNDKLYLSLNAYKTALSNLL